MTEPLDEDICRDDCTSGCHATDCEHHGHPARATLAPDARLREALTSWYSTAASAPWHLVAMTRAGGIVAPDIPEALLDAIIDASREHRTWPEDAKAFWDTHCSACAHDLHPMDVCSTIVGGDHDGPRYCPCTLDYESLAAEYQRAQRAATEAEDAALDAIEAER